MKVYLYKNFSQPNEINKQTESIELVEGFICEPTDVQNPVVRVGFKEEYLECNYIKIPLFKRFYFVKSVTFEKGTLTLSCKCDVLESFKSEILKYNGTLERSEYDYNLNLEDSEMPAYSKKELTYKMIGSNNFQSNLISGSEPQFVVITTSN